MVRPAQALPQRVPLHVKIDGQTYYVYFDETGKPTTVKRKAVYAEGRPWARIYAAQMWHRSQPVPKKAMSVVKRVLDIACARTPNAETQEAMRDCREGRVTRVETTAALIREITGD